MREHHKAAFVYTTWPSTESAVAAGRQLVEHHVAACVNILPAMTSIYRWQGEIESSTETVMIIKTVDASCADVERIVRSLHPATTPAIAVLPVAGGSADFLGWIAANSVPHQSDGGLT